MGKTVDVILYRGGLKVGDTIMCRTRWTVYNPYQGTQTSPRMAECETRESGGSTTVEPRGVKIVAPSWRRPSLGPPSILPIRTKKSNVQKKLSLRNGSYFQHHARDVLIMAKFLPVRIFHPTASVLAGSRRRPHRRRDQNRYRRRFGGFGVELHQRNIPVRQATVGPVNKRTSSWRNLLPTRFKR